MSEDATAVLLHYSYDTKISPNGSAETDVKHVYRLIAGKGGNQTVVNVLLSPNRKVTGLKGWRIDKNGIEQTLEKSDIVEIASDLNTSGYNEYSSLIATFPETFADDIIAYEYTIKEKKGSEGLYQNIKIRSGVELLEASASIALPTGWSLQYYSRNLDDVSYSVSEENVHTWSIARQPYYPDEPFMPDDMSLTRYIFVNCHIPEESTKEQFSTWQSVAQWAAAKYETQAIPDDRLRPLAANLTVKATTVNEKLRLIAEYVRDEIRYVAVELGEGRFQPRLASQTCSNKYGDCKDKSTLMCALLKAIHIPSCPVLINAGRPFDTVMTSPYQFNHVIIAIPESALNDPAQFAGAIKDGWLYFDPTAQTSPLGYLPHALYGGYCLHIDTESLGLQRMPDANPDDYRRDYRAEATLYSDNSIGATVRIVDRKKRAGQLTYTFKNSGVDELIKDWREHLGRSISNLDITNFTTGSDADSAWIAFSITGKQYVEASGDLKMIKADFIFPDRKSEMKKKVERHYPINFGDASTYTSEIIWTLPDGWIISEGLDSATASCAIAEIVCRCTAGNGVYKTSSQQSYTGESMEPGDYDEARGFDRKRCAIYSKRFFVVKP